MQVKKQFKMIHELQVSIGILKADKSELVETLQKAEDVETSISTKESREALEKAIENAHKVNDNDNATVDDVEEAIDVLEDAIKGLKLDKSPLETAIKDAQSMDTSQYTDETVSGLKHILEAAEKILENDETTYQQMHEAIVSIEYAKKSLKEKPVEIIPEPEPYPEPTPIPQPDTPQEPAQRPQATRPLTPADPVQSVTVNRVVTQTVMTPVVDEAITQEVEDIVETETPLAEGETIQESQTPLESPAEGSNMNMFMIGGLGLLAALLILFLLLKRRNEE